MIDPKPPTPPAPYNSTPTEPALKSVGDGSGPKTMSLPSGQKTGRVNNMPPPCDFSPKGNAIGAFPKTAAS